MQGNDHDSLVAHLRSMQIDNFTISGDIVRIGAIAWRAAICACGLSACDGWSLEPVARPSAAGLAVSPAPASSLDGDAG